MRAKFTILFEDSFWVGILEINNATILKIGKVIFGHEPGDSEIYEFVKNDYFKIKLNEIKCETKTTKTVNPKRMQRLVIKEQKKKGISTKSQAAMKKIQEEKKIDKKKENKMKKEENDEYKYSLKVEKKKKKEKGH